jgi:hypothetical protein
MALCVFGTYRPQVNPNEIPSVVIGGLISNLKPQISQIREEGQRVYFIYIFVPGNSRGGCSQMSWLQFFVKSV